MEMAEKGGRTGFQQGFSGKTDRSGGVFRWVAYILMCPRESGGQNRQKNERISPVPRGKPPGCPVGKEPARNTSCKVRLTTCARPFAKQADGTEWEGRGEGAKSCPFPAAGCQGRPIRTEGFPTVNVAVSGEIANFFTRTDPICWGKNRCFL